MNRPVTLERPPRSRRLGYVLIALGASLALLVGVAIPMPYVIEGPGPTFNVLGKDGDHPIISVSNADTYPTTGALRMVTVSVRGGPDTHVTGFEALLALLNPDQAVYPVEQIYPPNLTATDIKKRSAAQMEGSHVNAKVAALAELGTGVPAVMRVAGVAEDGTAAGKVHAGDIVRAVSVAGQRQDVTEAAVLFRSIEAATPADEIVLTLERDGQTVEVSLHGRAREDGPGVLMGIYLDPEISMPVGIDISLDNVGGPSAGMMFALGIIDRMTATDLANGLDIAGTGAVTMGGGVLKISGVPQKMRGAADAGAHWFLLPATNCADAIGHVPAGMRAVPVSNLSQARKVVEKIAAGALTGLPQCSG